MTTPTTLEIFLRASDPDVAAEARRRLDEPGAAAKRRIGEILDAWEDPQGVANLLMFPSLLPDDRRVEILLRGLASKEPRYWVLASAVGLRRFDRDALEPEERGRLVERLIAVAWRHADFAIHATAALHRFLEECDAERVFPLLEHTDTDVRHNILAWLVSVVGLHGVGHFTRVAEASGVDPQTRDAAVRRLRRHLERADAGRATPDAWLVHGSVPPLVELEG